MAGESEQHTRLSILAVVPYLFSLVRHSQSNVRSMQTTLVSSIVEFPNGVILIRYMTDNPADITYKLLWNLPPAPTLVNKLCKA